MLKRVFLFSVLLVMIFTSFGHYVYAISTPQKVITMGPNATEIMIALGLHDKIIGTTLNNHSRGPLQEYQAIYEALPELAFASASRESVITSGADFIFGIDWEFGENGLDIDELNQYGIEVYLEKAKSIEEVYNEISEISKIFNIEKKGEALIHELEKQVQNVNKNLPSSKKILVFDSGENGVFTAGGPNFETRLIEAAGAVNIFDDIKDKEWATVSLEEVVSRNPDYIIVHDYDQPSIEEKINWIKSNPILNQLNAVKEENFIILELESVLPGVRMGKTIQKINASIQ